MDPDRFTRSPLAVALAFLVLGGAWIFVTDMIASAWFPDPRVQTAKGLVFVAGTAALLWGLLRLDRERERRARKRLHETEHRFRVVVENAHEIISILDSDGRPLFRSEGFTRILGYAPGEIGSSFELIHPEDRPRVDTVFRQALDRPARTAGPVEFRMRHEDGSWRLLEGTAMDLSHVPAVGGVVVNARDVTERRAAEADRDVAEARFRSIVENAQEGIWVTDAGGRTTYVNEKMAAMMGTDREDLIGVSGIEYLPTERRHEYEERMERRRRGESDTTEIELVRADGERIWVQISASPVLDADGELVSVVGLITDISERRTVEERLRQRGRTEAVGRLAGGIAHDFNNLLTAIGGYAEMLERDFVEDDPRRQYVEEIVRAAGRAADLTDQLLAFGRQQMLEPRTLDLGAMVRKVGPVLENLVPESVTIEIAAPDDLPRVRVDPQRIEEILVHLVVNAHEAMPEGGRVRVELAREQVESDLDVGTDTEVSADGYVALAVEDEGVGMDEDVRSHAFEPFFTTKPSGEGAGLGLSSVYGLVKQSGGYVWIEEGRERGTAVRILLPAVETASEESEADAAPPDPGSSDARKRTILVVEDEPSVRRLACTVLEGAGHAVLEAEGGEEALAKVEGRRAPVDLVVTDVVMPSMGGRELVARLRERWPDLGVVFMSGYTDTGMIEDAERSGAEFLAKPFTPADLIAKVRATTGSVLSD